MYNQASSCVVHNFLLERGVRQGCPLSGLLFVIGIELFARALRKEPTIRGIRVCQKEINSTQYADDTTVFVRYFDSVSMLLKLLDDFKGVSGLQIYTYKTEAMWLGSWRNRNEKPFGFKWPQDSAQALGVNFSYNPQRSDKLYF